MNIKKLTVVFLAVVLLFANTTLTSSAYHLSGYKWDTNTINYYLKTKSDRGIKAFKRAASEWTKSTNVTLKKTSNPNKENTVVCTTTSKKKVEWDGLCKWYVIGNRTTKATIYLNRAKKSFKTVSARQSIAVHEFGHALGLEHKNGKYIMNPYTLGKSGRWGAYKIKTPQKDDIKGVNYLYKKGTAK